MVTRARILEALAAAPVMNGRVRISEGVRLRGDHDFDDSVEEFATAKRRAAVLVPIVEHPDELTVLLTRRTDHLSSHAGQVSFPGGRIEPTDADATEAALREAEEEIGLPRDRVEAVGRLDDYLTGTGYVVTPIVAFVKPPFALHPDPNEVADVFEVPLAFFLDAANHQRRVGFWRGRERVYYAMPYGERYIWGATAGMLLNLYEVLTR
jgi:8-oxo-dGTP pyrophosphatase MutT (NUDIX family)